MSAATPTAPDILIDVIAAAEAKNPEALMVKVGDYGFVRLLDCMPRLVREGSIGMEASIVEAARVSFAGGIKKRSEDLPLLRYLMRNKHMSPFEMVEFTFVVSCELFTARQWFRHRTAALNEISARYSEIEDHYYKPSPANVRAQSASCKQGSDDGSMLSAGAKAGFADGVKQVVKLADSVYRKALQDGIAREQARAVLPVGTYTQFYWKQNARNLMHFLELRMDSHAQKEIREYATGIYTILRYVAPHLIELFDIYMAGAVQLSALEIRALREGVAPAEMSATERKEWETKRAKLLPAVDAITGPE
jgi:thymidylate synthase (FAD)